MSVPVHVSQTSQHMSCFAKVTVLLVVTPQQVHVVHFTLVLLDHVHQMFLQVRRIHLDSRKDIRDITHSEKIRNIPTELKYNVVYHSLLL